MVTAQPAAPSPAPVPPVQAAALFAPAPTVPQSRPVAPERSDAIQAAPPSGASAVPRTNDVPIGAPASRAMPPQAPAPFPSAALPSSPRTAAPSADSAVPAASRSDTIAATPSKAPINPFLANDPNQKAKRLARALVSDMVAYHPQKRDEGLRAGTLKQLFREEIKKSYEEYVDQIGKDFAETTSHFQDALNDVLAGGKKVF
jgi:hypothetical protein